jgi:hypothetical protein
MGAFAGWLHHPAHAPSHHKNDCRAIFHGADCYRQTHDASTSFAVVSKRHEYVAPAEIAAVGCVAAKRIIKWPRLDFVFDGKECRDCSTVNFKVP